MDNNEWDDSLKNLLGNHKPEDMQPDWDAFANYMREHDFLEELGEDADFDENLRHTLSSYEAPGQIEGWNRIESALTHDALFDEAIRDRIHQFKPHYNPRTWPLLLSRLSGAGYLRAKLIAFKVVEVSAVFLLLFTVVKMGQMGKLPFDTPLYERNINQPESNELIPGDRTDNSKQIENDVLTSPSSSALQTASADKTKTDLLELQVRSNPIGKSVSAHDANQINQINTQQTITPAPSSIANDDANSTADEIKTINNNEISHTPIIANSPVELNPVPTANNRDAFIGPFEAGMNDRLTKHEMDLAGIDDVANESSIYNIAVANLNTTSISPVEWNDHLFLPKPKYIKKSVGTHTEFGIVSQIDYNRMQMPEDKFYSAGKQVVFPEKGLRNTSLGSGFTIAIGHPKWAIETGLIYSSKKFKPGRHLVVKSGFTNSSGSVEFEAMNLQLISLPLQFRYRINHKGPFRFYAFTGFGLHLIAKSDIDVLIKYEFATSAPAIDPKEDPKNEEIFYNTRRISEHIRDGAPFSTKTFLSLNGGLGCEYSLSSQKTLFLQSGAQYQLPNVKFSNNNGKNIRSVSIQGGVRMPIGK